MLRNHTSGDSTRRAPIRNRTRPARGGGRADYLVPTPRQYTDHRDHWPAEYRALIERRLQAIQENRWIKLIEQPEYKRRWNREPWEKRQERALKDWLLDHLEQLCQAAELQTCAQLADRTRHDDAFQRVAALYTDSDTFDSQALVSELVAADNVPQMAAARYKALRKY